MGDKLICITKNRKAMKIIILHDADARIEYLDVADHLLGSDIEEFLTRQGFSVNNITWLVTSADHIPVVYHKYDIDCKTGEATLFCALYTGTIMLTSGFVMTGISF